VTTALALLAFATLLTTVGAPLLRRAGWVDRAPRLGIVAWQALTTSITLAVALAGVTMVIPAPRLGNSLSEIVMACLMYLQGQFTTVGGAATVITGTALTLAVTARAAFSAGATLVTARAQRRLQANMITLVARRDERLDALIVDHRDAAVFCLPGRKGHIVLTSATLAALDEAELQAVLAHERAHLQGRHHLVLAGGQALARAFGFVPAFRHADEEITRLVEMVADDVAARRHCRRTIASAVVAMAGSTAPQAALGMGGAAIAFARVSRLVEPTRPLGALRAAAIIAAVTVLVALPLGMALAPALAAIGVNCCLV
jgi:Zn-dependent protease with chaperone function